MQRDFLQQEPDAKEIPQLQVLAKETERFARGGEQTEDQRAEEVNQ